MIYKSLKEICEIATDKEIPFWKVIQKDDCTERNVEEEDSFEQMRAMYRAMVHADEAYTGTRKSNSGMVGGDGKRLESYVAEGKSMSGPFIGKVMERAVKMGESNACMRRIVAAPTAGSCGVLPAVLLTYAEYWDHIIWVTGAFDFYQKTGDKNFLRQAYVASANTMKKLEAEEFDSKYGMFMGPSVFNDGIAGYEEPIYDSKYRSSYVLDHPASKTIKCLSTNCIYYNAYLVLAEMAAIEGDKAAKKTYIKKAENLKAAIRQHLFDAKANKLNYLIDGEGDVK